MPIASVNDSGLRFYYEDSGALPGLYVTLVFIHGTAFTSGIFRRMLPFATPNRVRLVLLNRRDYPGSTPFDTDELAALSSSDVEAKRAALRKIGLEYGAFLTWFIREQCTPPITHQNGRREGGIVLVAWSLAHSSAAPLIACPNELPYEQRVILDEHFRSYITLDTPSASFGLPLLSLYHPLTEESVPPLERVTRFEQWISAYYDHSSDALEKHDTSLLDASPLPYPNLACTSNPPPTLLSMNPVDKDAISWTKPIASSELFLYTMPPDILYEHTRLALFDSTMGKVLPNCEFILLWGGRGSWTSVSAAWDIERLYRQRFVQDQGIRTLKIFELPWANHFAHWDEPEMTVRELASVC